MGDEFRKKATPGPIKGNGMDWKYNQKCNISLLYVNSRVRPPSAIP